MAKRLIKEYYDIKQAVALKTKKGKGFRVVYVDPKTSTDSTFENKELMKEYGMEYLPYNRYIKYVQGVPHAWGWIVWDGEESKMFPIIKKFASEIGAKETPMENGDERTAEEVLSALEDIKSLILDAKDEPIVQRQGTEIISKAEDLKKQLAFGIGSKETMAALAELMRFREAMKRHMGHPLSFMNLLLVWIQKRNATDVRSKGEWADMGYTPKEGAEPVMLAMPNSFKKFYGEKYDEIVRKFLKKQGVNSISELTPSEKRRLDRETKYPDPRGGFKTYAAYDISDMIKGEGAEEFPENTFDWYDKISDETEKERVLIDACIAFGKSIGIKSYAFKSAEELGGSRGSASNKGNIAIVDDKRNHGLLSTVIHETAHQIMHWEVVKTTSPRLAKFYRGGSATRGTQIVEQEAELCAWIVLSGFGYEKQQQHFNYLANWGMTQENCNNVFDGVMKVAQFIYDGMQENMSKEQIDNKE